MREIKKRYPKEWALHDDRSISVNTVCKLIYDKNNGDLEKCIAEIKPIYDNSFASIRNIYELVDSEIPMFYLYRLQTLGSDNWDFEDLGTDIFTEIDKASKACHEYFSDEAE